jgi:hypothetical protein
MLQERNGLPREYIVGMGFPPYPTPVVTLKFNLFIALNSSSTLTLSKCLNFSSCVIGDLEIEIRQWAFLVKINAVATKPWLCRLQKLRVPCAQATFHFVQFVQPCFEGMLKFK